MGEALSKLDLDDPEAGLLAYSIQHGKVTAEQGKEIFERISAAAGEGRKLRLYYELHSIPSTEGSVILEKLKQLGTILKTIERLAIVGDQRWLPAYRAIVDPITRMDIRHFTTDQADEARAWIRE